MTSSQCGPHPLACFVEKLRMGGNENLVRHHSYVGAIDYSFGQPAEFYETLSGQPGWKVERLPGGHDLMIDSPTALADLLLEEVDRS